MVAKMGKVDIYNVSTKMNNFSIQSEISPRTSGLSQISGLSLPKINWWKTYWYVFIYCLNALQFWVNHNFAAGYSLFMSEIFNFLKIFKRYSRIHHNKKLFPFENPFHDLLKNMLWALCSWSWSSKLNWSCTLFRFTVRSVILSMTGRLQEGCLLIKRQFVKV